MTARRRKPAIDRFLKKVDQTDSCWLWVGAIAGRTGYGTFWGKDRLVGAHRWAYEHYVGPIADGLDIDHICRVRACVRPEHLRAVPHVVNIRSGEKASRQVCPRGHAYDAENTYTRKSGGRVCRACARERDQSRRRAS